MSKRKKNRDPKVVTTYTYVPHGFGYKKIKNVKKPSGCLGAVVLIGGTAIALAAAWRGIA